MQHTGWTPELEMRKQQMQELLTRRSPAPAPLSTPVPITVETPPADGLALVLAKLTELTVGVNELRACQASAVTRADLQEFHEKASAEHKAFVASQTELLSDALSNLDKWHSLHSDRIAELEKQVANLKKHKRQVPDASYTKLAVNFCFREQ